MIFMDMSITQRKKFPFPNDLRCAIKRQGNVRAQIYKNKIDGRKMNWKRKRRWRQGYKSTIDEIFFCNATWRNWNLQFPARVFVERIKVSHKNVHMSSENNDVRESVKIKNVEEKVQANVSGKLLPFSFFPCMLYQVLVT